MFEFNLQHPKTRGYLNEFLFHKLLNYSNLISLRTNYINFSINSDNESIFNIEETFSKELIENNKRREGIILGLMMIRYYK